MKRNQKKEEQKMRFIYNAIQDGYSVKKNDNGTYTFTNNRDKDEPLKSFINRCIH